MLRHRSSPVPSPDAEKVLLLAGSEQAQQVVQGYPGGMKAREGSHDAREGGRGGHDAQGGPRHVYATSQILQIQMKLWCLVRPWGQKTSFYEF